MNTDTPRTDALISACKEMNDSDKLGIMRAGIGMLERELNQLRAVAEGLADALRPFGAARPGSEVRRGHLDAAYDVLGTYDALTTSPEALGSCDNLQQPEQEQQKGSYFPLIGIKELYDAMPPDLQRKVSCHDLKRTIDNYNRNSWSGIATSPSDGTVFLAFAPHDCGGFAFAACRNLDNRLLCMMSGDDFTDTVTHWMPLPPPPRGVAEKAAYEARKAVAFREGRGA